jgi:hypothetical protein
MGLTPTFALSGNKRAPVFDSASFRQARSMNQVAALGQLPVSEMGQLTGARPLRSITKPSG